MRKIAISYRMMANASSQPLEKTRDPTPAPAHASGLSASVVQRLSGGASRLAALLLPQILPVSSVVAPCHPGAALRNPVLLQRRRATSSDPLPRGTYHIGSASTMEIRHYNYEIRHLASDRLTRTGEKFSAFEASVSNHRNGRSAGHSPPRRLSQSQRSQRVHGWRPRLNASTNADDKALTKSSRTSGGNPGRHVHETVRNARDRRPFEHSERCCMVESFLTDRL